MRPAWGEPPGRSSSSICAWVYPEQSLSNWFTGLGRDYGQPMSKSQAILDIQSNKSEIRQLPALLT